MLRSTCDSAAKLTTASAWPTSGSATRRVGDIALDEQEAVRAAGVVVQRLEVRPVAGVGQLVEDGDRGAVVTRQDLADVLAADEPGAARDEEPAVGGRGRHPTGLATGGVSRPASSSSFASAAARSRLGTVPASAQCPS